MMDITISIKAGGGDKPMMNMGHDSSKTPGHPFPPKKMEDPMMPKKMGSEYESDKVAEYTVQSGETLESIAKKYGCEGKDLMLLNQKHDKPISDTVSEGQKILVPTTSEKEDDSHEEE